jgi:hypothetical protein
MSKSTVFIAKGKKCTILTQQYTSGLYVAVYREGNPIPEQCGVEEKEDEFHRNLRKDIEKQGDTLVVNESSPMSTTTGIKPVACI